MYQKEKPKQDLSHVCILLVMKGDKVMVEPCDSEKLQGKVLKALSYKFEKECELDEALKCLNSKYQLSGINNPTEKIKNGKKFQFEKKTSTYSQSNNVGSYKLQETSAM